MARPKKEEARTRNTKIRLTDSEYGMILMLADEKGDSFSDVIRRALRVYFNLTKSGVIDDNFCGTKTKNH